MKKRQLKKVFKEHKALDLILICMFTLNNKEKGQAFKERLRRRRLWK